MGEGFALRMGGGGRGDYPLMTKFDLPDIPQHHKIKSLLSSMPRVFQIALRGRMNYTSVGGIENFAWWIFSIGLWKSDEEWIWPFKPFTKIKTTFYKYWTLIKIKIGITCLYKEYDWHSNKNGTGAMTTAKKFACFFLSFYSLPHSHQEPKPWCPHPLFFLC